MILTQDLFDRLSRISHRSNDRSFANGHLSRFAENDTDPAADKRTMDRVSSVTRAYGVNDGTGKDNDLLPGF